MIALKIIDLHPHLTGSVLLRKARVGDLPRTLGPDHIEPGPEPARRGPRLSTFALGRFCGLSIPQDRLRFSRTRGADRLASDVSRSASHGGRSLDVPSIMEELPSNPSIG